MREILRFKDLVARNIVGNWPRLKALVEEQGFPVGFYLSPNRRAWFADEIEAWLESRPDAITAKPPLKGRARLRAEAKLARAPAASTGA